ncbi:SWI/SNF complex component snf12 [Arachnomyces sp. PD_36]|nr:SWI/SNF complex component snf12 [Arachnomyces sp. PD_36]
MNNTPLQPGYRGYTHAQAQHRSPATPRRGPPMPGGMPGPSPHHPQQGLAPTPQQAMARRDPGIPNDSALRRSRRPTDKNIPDGIEDAIIGDGVQEYKSLRDLEKRLDSAMIRKRLDIQDSVNRTVKKYRTLRIWISNTVENQPWQLGADQNGTAPGTGKYKVKIEGRLLDDYSDPTVPDDSDDEGDARDADAMEQDEPESKKRKTITSTVPRKRLSHFFKSITIDLDKTSQTRGDESTTIAWNKPNLPPNVVTLPPSADFDSLEFSRPSEDNLNATINLTRDENPDRFTLSKDLADILDVDEEARGGIVVGIWDYIKAMGLQEDEEKRIVRCDDRLKRIFHKDQIFFPAIPESVTANITPLEPIKLPYTIRVDRDFHNDPTPTVYDVRVAVDDPLRAKMLALTTSQGYPAMLRQISTYDDQLALVIQALLHAKAKHSFYTTLSKDPANFVTRWNNSQRRDLETILGEATRGGGEDGTGPEFRRGGANGVWDTAVAKEAVRYMLAKPDVPGH